ncbi:MAG: imidazole glycerol phosphate synthase subunit HisH [Flavobacterium psychrophilum]|nr:MAG: imidazole glycerol phosphate synthase subunit HisH [Flavobacterium psychrophilum]
MSQKKVVIVDYGHGNLYSINQACVHVGYNPVISSRPEDILSADSLILPGVGAFKVAMDELASQNLIEPIKEFVEKGNYLMGVCLGMQLLFDESEEFGPNKGLGFIEGKIVRFPKTFNDLKVRVPHIGWNKLFLEDYSVKWKDSPLEDLTDEDYMYFIHSYYALPADEKNILSQTNYQDFKYCSSVQKENVFGFQFHPEKSSEKGLTIYKNFLKL